MVSNGGWRMRSLAEILHHEFYDRLADWLYNNGKMRYWPMLVVFGILPAFAWPSFSLMIFGLLCILAQMVIFVAGLHGIDRGFPYIFRGKCLFKENK